MSDLTALVSVGMTIAGTVATVLTAALALGWKIRGWIADLNTKRERSYQALKDDLHQQLDFHEAKDQQRHEENLARFANIGERLARMGNGRSSH